MSIMTPTIIDIEASGFGSQSYPIEVGVITADGRRFCRLIKPLPHWSHWDPQAEGLHGISKQDLVQHGEDPRRVCHQLNAFLNTTTVYSDGWTVDSSWINRLFGDVGVNMVFHVSPLELILSEAQMSIWHRVKESMLKRQDCRRHRASNDAKLVQSTYSKTKEMLEAALTDCQ
ncbi:hypothetical protein DRW07_01450 [Alteromonas sediminis]|uniref:Exonuclease domain-containing protein n=1 Tax=Alteromonas sediminis TaxID=2259342 RepID=A0A3N5YEF3_9ALTE|nr:hypothetical protein [Alteromonas sediminis]RPJ68105.1 hypothetical protein DRW07_01450 [Alteromonas sediminis]